MNIKEHIEQLAEKQQSAWFHKDDVKRIIEELLQKKDRKLKQVKSIIKLSNELVKATQQINPDNKKRNSRTH